LEKKKITKVTPGNLLELFTLGYIMKKNSEVYFKEVLDEIKKFDITWDISHGTYYPVINSMIKHGYVNYIYNYDQKKYYEITSIGRDYYNSNSQNYKELLNKTSEFYTDIARILP